MSTVLLFHDEMLNPEHPLIAQNRQLPRLYIFDTDQIQRDGFALKRLQFIADALAEIPGVRVYRGSTTAVLQALGSTGVVTQATPQTWLHEALAPFATEWVEERPLAQFSGRPKRFMAYWKAVEAQILKGG